MKARPSKSTVLAVALVTASAAGVLRAELVAYWDFDDGRGNIVTDRYGCNDGNCVGEPNWVEGRTGAALYFDGAEDYIDCGANQVFDINDQITISAWIQVYGFDKDWQAIISKGDSAWRLQRMAQLDTIAFHLSGITLADEEARAHSGVDGMTNVNDGQWHHLVGVYDGQRLCLYINGMLDSALVGSGGISRNTHNVLIGENIERRGRLFYGVIDEVAVFNNALTADEVRKLHSEGCAAFIAPSLSPLISAVKDALALLNAQQPKQAVKLIEKRIAEYERWRAENPDKAGIRHGLMVSKLYLMLATAKERSGAPADAIVEALKKSVSLSLLRPGSVNTLVRLWDDTSQGDYAEAVKSGVANSGPPDQYMYGISRDFVSKGDWPAFEMLLDNVLGRAEDVNSAAAATARGMEPNVPWTDNFMQYCRRKPKLRPYYVQVTENLAEADIRQDKFLEAAESYRDIAKLQADKHNKMAYELKVCECMLWSGLSVQAISELDAFIASYENTGDPTVIEAFVLKAQVYLQAGQVEQAYKTLAALAAENSKARETAPVNFFLGYCRMQLEKLDEAKATLELVLNKFPDSPYVLKAKLCLRKIERMMKGKTQI
ncbi:MAG: hypothetical protein JSU94_02610 [Phycisphaerales bacterium]|nr:MAG: hypothetical protein JSU94_02610 [Phycisphaerales bacterium]